MKEIYRRPSVTIRVIGWALGCVATVNASLLWATEPLADEGIRTRVLGAIFPGMAISAVAGRTLDYTRRTESRVPLLFPDALASQRIYTVKGPPIDDCERCAAQDLLNGRMTEVREVRFLVFRWPGDAFRNYLAVVQYRFSASNPPGFCRSLAMLVRVISTGDEFAVESRHLFNTDHHSQLESVRLTPVLDELHDDLIVESDTADRTGDVQLSELHLMSLVSGNFKEIVTVTTRMHVDSTADAWTQELDISSSRARHGQVCFLNT